MLPFGDSLRKLAKRAGGREPQRTAAFVADSCVGNVIAIG